MNYQSANYAKIAINTIQLPFGKHRNEYEWVGESDVALINEIWRWELPELKDKKPGDSFWLGHMEVVIVDYDIYSDIFKFALADGQGYQRFYNQRVYYWLENLKCRFILTLYVWGLATFEPGRKITWDAIKRPHFKQAKSKANT